ncbi:arylsulfatase B-like [Sycon ciliatum]|uniref:arylsulfatase B-like n=1 Tax=Sycon ciliatum TaxID=27933 RepID=UPI0031F6E144
MNWSTFVLLLAAPILVLANQHHIDEKRKHSHGAAPAEGESNGDAAQVPHIIMYVIDDLGWNDVSYNGAEFSTPNIDFLANAGIKLNQYYVNRVCSPTRSSFMAGRYAYNMGQDGNVITNGHPYSLPLNHTTLGDKMKEAGYSTHAIGKWDLGYYKWAATPTRRGFDTFYGYYNADEDYFTHKCGAMYVNTTTKKRVVMTGVDFRNNEDPEVDQNGVYSTHVFTEQAEELIMAHNATKEPFFLYMAYQAVHGPLEAPQKYIDMCAHISRMDRRIFCGMMMALDEGIGNITKRLKASGMWENTLIVFTTDNGGQNHVGGNNWPLRGNKATMWEGGVRGIGFVSGVGVSKPFVYNGLMHASDWLPTLANVGGATPATKQVLDGVNVWQELMANTTSPRSEVLITLNPPRTTKPAHPNQRQFLGTAAIRMENWKLILGEPDCAGAAQNETTNGTMSMCPNGWVHPSGIEVPPPANSDNVWLFDLDADPLEKNDVHAQHPDVVEKLRQRIETFNATHINQVEPPVDPASNPALTGGVWSPWIKDDELA